MALPSPAGSHGGGHRGILDGTMFAERYGGKVVTQLDAFGEEHKARIRRYREFWKLYKGFHWDFARGAGDPGNEAMVTINYAKRIVDVHVNFLMKNGFDITIPDIAETPEDERQKHVMVKSKLDEIWRYNDKPLTSFEIAQNGSITGDTFLRVFWREAPALAPPHAAIEIIPSHLSFPEYGGMSGFDRKTMSRFTLAMPRFEESSNLTMRGRVRSKKLVMWSEVWTRTEVQVWREDKMVSQKEHRFGEIPIVHIRNYPVAGEVYGMSDLHLVWELQREINEKATDISDVINYHGSPITVLKGAKITQLDRGANRVWSIPADADAFNLELGGDLAASHKFLELLLDSMFDLAGVPRSAFGKQQNVTGTSAVALGMQYLPLMEIRSVKERTYGEGLRRLHRILLKVTETMDRKFGREFEQLNKHTRYITEIAWPPPLPRDTAVELGHATTRLDIGISTRERELMKMGHGEADAKTIVADALAESQQFAQAEFNVGGGLPGGGGNPNPKRPDVTRQGEKVSRKAETPKGPAL